MMHLLYAEEKENLFERAECTYHFISVHCKLFSASTFGVILFSPFSKFQFDLDVERLKPEPLAREIGRPIPAVLGVK